MTQLTAEERERLELARERLYEIPDEDYVKEPYRDFFRREALFLIRVLEAGEKEPAAELNRSLYEDILPENYGSSYGNPDYAAQMLGEEGKLFSFLYTELFGMIAHVYEKNEKDILILLELFLEIYHMYGPEEAHSPALLKTALVSWVSDYCPFFVENRIRETLDPSLSFASDIVKYADLSDLSYLYRYGEYVTENEIRTAAFLNSLGDEEVESMARVLTEGFRQGFVHAGIDLGKKKTVRVFYNLGFERIVRQVIRLFEETGLSSVLYRPASHSVNRRGVSRNGYTGAIPNKQFDYDHRNDAALYLDSRFVTRKLSAVRKAYEKYKALANAQAGPAVMEVFGEVPFEPAAKTTVLTLSAAQRKQQVRMDSESIQITNRYIIAEERSFSIIDWPVPEIGEDFEKIFRETVRINTLDSLHYQRIQQALIDVLDEGYAAHITGRGANETDLTIAFQTLADPEKQTLFENCVADVNIPVGEVFTSPVLKGTEGLLHVTGVYLDGLHYSDLKIRVKDGMITDYSCRNFEDEEENRRFIEENILNHHPSVPMGEFAIGTNTTAYRVAQDYSIADKLPILIAEKMGPHFAFGDTCYSYQEDIRVYNPDGKEIIAKENECSRLRSEDPSKAYFGCHTDVTIPYDELGSITVLKKDGSEVDLIRGGRFVLPGTEELNEPLDRP